MGSSRGDQLTCRCGSVLGGAGGGAWEWLPEDFVQLEQAQSREERRTERGLAGESQRPAPCRVVSSIIPGMMVQEMRSQSPIAWPAHTGSGSMAILPSAERPAF